LFLGRNLEQISILQIEGCAQLFFWIGLINMFAFWVFTRFGQELKLKNFEHKIVEDSSEALDV
jgi:hypothetical protein